MLKEGSYGIAGEWVPDKPQQEQRCVPIRGVELKWDGSLGDVGNSTLWSEMASDMTNAMGHPAQVSTSCFVEFSVASLSLHD